MRYGSFAHVSQEGLQQYRTLSQPSGITLSPKCSAEDYFQHHSRRCSSSSNCKRLRSLRQRIVRDYIHMFFLLSPPTRYFHRNHVHPPQSLEGKPFSFLYCTYHSTGLSHQKSRSRSTPSMEEHWSIAWKNWINKLWLHAARDAEGQESQNKEKTLWWHRLAATRGCCFVCYPLFMAVLPNIQCKRSDISKVLRIWLGMRNLKFEFDEACTCSRSGVGRCWEDWEVVSFNMAIRAMVWCWFPWVRCTADDGYDTCVGLIPPETRSTCSAGLDST